MRLNIMAAGRLMCYLKIIIAIIIIIIAIATV
jgi:hypothetical protein